MEGHVGIEGTKRVERIVLLRGGYGRAVPQGLGRRFAGCEADVVEVDVGRPESGVDAGAIDAREDHGPPAVELRLVEPRMALRVDPLVRALDVTVELDGPDVGKIGLEERADDREIPRPQPDAELDLVDLSEVVELPLDLDLELTFAPAARPESLDPERSVPVRQVRLPLHRPDVGRLPREVRTRVPQVDRAEDRPQVHLLKLEQISDAPGHLDPRVFSRSHSEIELVERETTRPVVQASTNLDRPERRQVVVESE